MSSREKEMGAGADDHDDAALEHALDAAFEPEGAGASALEGDRLVEAVVHTVRTLVADQQDEKAVPLLRECLRAGTADRAHVDGLQAALGAALLRLGQPGEAEPVLRACLDVRARQRPGTWLHYNAMSLLGEALLAQGAFAQAEPLLLGCYPKLRAPGPMARRKGEVRARIVELYERWDKPDKAAAWRDGRK